MTPVSELMRRMPELLLIEPRLADPDWHPTQQELADAWTVVKRPEVARQSALNLAQEIAA